MARRFINSVPRARGIYLLGQGTGSTVSSGTAEVALQSVTVPAGLLGANGLLYIYSRWLYTNSGNNKTPRIRFGTGVTPLTDTIYFSLTLTTTVNMQWLTVIGNMGAVNSQEGFPVGVSPYNFSANAVATSAIDTDAAATAVTFSGQPATGGESIALRKYSVWLMPGVA